MWPPSRGLKPPPPLFRLLFADFVDLARDHGTRRDVRYSQPVARSARGHFSRFIDFASAASKLDDRRRLPRPQAKAGGGMPASLGAGRPVGQQGGRRLSSRALPLPPPSPSTFPPSPEACRLSVVWWQAAPATSVKAPRAARV